LRYRFEKVSRHNGTELRFVSTREHFRNPPRTELTMPSLTVIISWRKFMLKICGNSHESSEIVTLRMSQFLLVKI
jgi:hypothetical protein